MSNQFIEGDEVICIAAPPPGVVAGNHPTGTVLDAEPHGFLVRINGANLTVPASGLRRLRSMQGKYAIIYPDVINRSQTAPGGSLDGYFRVRNMDTGEETTLYTEGECVDIIQRAIAGELKGSFGTCS